MKSPFAFLRRRKQGGDDEEEPEAEEEAPAKEAAEAAGESGEGGEGGEERLKRRWLPEWRPSRMHLIVAGAAAGAGILGGGALWLVSGDGPPTGTEPSAVSVVTLAIPPPSGQRPGPKGPSLNEIASGRVEGAADTATPANADSRGASAPPAQTAPGAPETPAPGGGQPPTAGVASRGALAPPAQTAPSTPGMAAPGADRPATAAPAPPAAPAAPGTLNAVAQAVTARDPGAGVMVPSVTPAAYAALPIPPAPKAVPAAPDAALLEKRPDGTELPKPGSGGRMAWKAYALPFEAAGNRPRVALVVVDLGLSRASTEAAIRRLPAAVTLAFDPYSPSLTQWFVEARQAGHETLLTLPMESEAFPAVDPGPMALLTSLKPAENVARLEAVLVRAAGYVGVISAKGSRFTTSDQQLPPVLKGIKDRGLLFIDGGDARASAVPKLAADMGLPSATSQVVLDREPSRAGIDARLGNLEEMARTQGSVVATAHPYPATLAQLVAWIGTLDGKGIALVPVSAVVSQPRT